MMRHLSALRHIVFGFAALIGGFATSVSAAEQRPVPTVVIYPGESIRDDVLSDAEFPDAATNGVFVSSREMLVGKVAKRTLLPGQPIPINAIGQPRLVTIGSMVRLVYSEGGLIITTYASALQNGAAGDLVSVRNSESGIVVSGIVQADGSIHVGAS